MKSFIKTFLCFFIGIHHSIGQDTAVIFSTTMFDDNQVIYLSSINGWLFKSGNDVSWASNDLDIRGWENMNPAALSAKYTDKNGRAEGWFRLKFKLDGSLRNIPIGVRRGAWAATDIYIDGILLISFGSTGYEGGSYKEYNPIDKQLVPVNVEPGKEHLLALHFVDYLSPVPPRQLKSETIGGARLETGGLPYFIMFGGPKYDLFTSHSARVTLLYRSIWASVTLLLAVLFWLLVFQNPREKRTLILIAVYSSFSALSNLTRFPLTDTRISFLAYEMNDLLQKFCLWMVLVTTFMIITSVLNFRLSRSFRRLLIAYSILGGSAIFFNFFGLLLTVNAVIVLFIYIYILSSSWKKLKGAQWAIAGGLLLSIAFAVLLIAFPAKNSNFELRLSLLSFFYFSFPLSLVVYVSLRFREIIRDVEENASQVVQMTREREEEAIKQQEILKEEVNRQTLELRTTLNNLRSTQSQLIQSEKMASLGELTAGIAHEIQNPLNFVNNFSEVNKELIDELKSKNVKLKIDDGEVNELLDDIAQNLEKINFHGRRADAIVKGMLQHSRTSSGQKELTDINALCDEYLRLAYHGLRAKDKSFNADIKTEFDNNAGKINIIPQDIGRVILNLINNALYAVGERVKLQAASLPTGQAGYKPQVIVHTRKLGDKVEIRVEDNGNGIPKNIVDKIFQPFFTTKPTGQGTGLGLSLAYDIIKAHGGEIRVETKEEEGSEFIIQLPVARNTIFI